MNNARKLVKILLVVFIAVLVGTFATQGQDETPLTGTLIINAAYPERNQEVEVIAVGDSEARNITADPAVDIAYSVSADRSSILFGSNRGDGDFELYTTNIEGGNIVQLTDNDASDNFGRFSPDGSQIAFVSDQDGTGDIYLMDNDGTNVTRLTTSEIRELALVWSPDGEKIAFLQVLDSTNSAGGVYTTLNFNIGFISVTGGETNLIVENIMFRSTKQINAYFAWSPDSASILYRSVEGEQDTELFLIDIATGEITQLTNNEDEESGFTWTDDGQIIYASFGGYGRSYSAEELAAGIDSLTYLYLMDADGENTREIAALDNVNSAIENLVFAPSSQYVIFEHRTLGSNGNQHDLWGIDLEGQTLINITNTPDFVEGSFFYVPSVSGSSE